MAYLPEFAELINRALARLDRSPSWLAQRIDVNPSTVSRWLNQGARPGDPEIVVRVADALGMTGQVQELLTAAGYGYVGIGAQAEPEITPAPAQAIPLRSAPPFNTNLPAAVTPFLGRERELVELAGLLADPKLRLLSIIGLGGMGKTRLAIEAARHFYEDVDAVPDGVFFAALENLGQPEQIPGAIASSLGLPATGADPQRLLLYHLTDKRLLLVLDNFEHLLDGAGLVAEILAAAPQVKILVTSREKLNLQEEWLFPVGGLDLPDTPVNPMAQAQASGAVQLFLQGARRVQAGRDFTADLPCIVELCQLVAGAPLALELAAHWLRLLSCSQIVAQLQESLDLLATPARNVAVRQRSMRAVFDYSWQLAGKAERAILCQLAVYEGGFDWPAFQAVTCCSVMALAALVDASWVQVSKEGRYSLHPLVRSYLQEKLAQEYPALAGEEMQAVTHRHSQYYSQVASDASTSLLLREISNLIAGWRHAIQRLDIASLRGYVDPMATFGSGLQWPVSLMQTDELLAESVDRVRQQSMKGSSYTDGIAYVEVEAMLLTARLNLARRAGRLMDADRLAAEALTLLKDSGDGTESLKLRFRIHIVLSNLASYRGRYTEAELMLNNLAASTFDPIQHHMVAGMRSLNALDLGQYEVAEAYLRKAMPMWQNKTGMFVFNLFLTDISVKQGAVQVARHHLSVAQALVENAIHLGRLELAQFQAFYELLVDNPDEAYALCRGVLPEFRAYGYALSLVRILVVFGQACLASSRLDEAESVFQEACELAAEMEYVSVHAQAMLGLAACALRREQPQDGEAYARQALALVWPCGLLPLALESVVNLAETRILSGNTEKARVWLRVTVAHSAAAYLVRVRAQKLLESIGGENDEAEISDLKSALAEIVSGLLAENG